MSGSSLELLRAESKAAVPRSSVTPAAATQIESVETDEEEEECLAFGYLRGIRERALHLDLRFANGNCETFPYSWLGPVKYNPSAGLLLKFVGDLVYLVLIEGSNLNALVKGAVSLYDRGLQRHRITFVREMTRQQRERAGEGEVAIERIRILCHRPDEEPKGIAWLEPFGYGSQNRNGHR